MTGVRHQEDAGRVDHQVHAVDRAGEHGRAGGVTVDQGAPHDGVESGHQRRHRPREAAAVAGLGLRVAGERRGRAQRIGRAPPAALGLGQRLHGERRGQRGRQRRQVRAGQRGVEHPDPADAVQRAQQEEGQRARHALLGSLRGARRGGARARPAGGKRRRDLGRQRQCRRDERAHRAAAREGAGAHGQVAGGEQPQPEALHAADRARPGRERFERAGRLGQGRSGVVDLAVAIARRLEHDAVPCLHDRVVERVEQPVQARGGLPCDEQGQHVRASPAGVGHRGARRGPAHRRRGGRDARGQAQCRQRVAQAIGDAVVARQRGDRRDGHGRGAVRVRRIRARRQPRPAREVGEGGLHLDAQRRRDLALGVVGQQPFQFRGHQRRQRAHGVVGELTRRAAPAPSAVAHDAHHAAADDDLGHGGP